MEFKLLNIEDIRLDLENPRVAEQLESAPPEWTDDEKEEWVADLLGTYDNKERGCSAEQLRKSIIESEGIIEPIIVQENSNDNNYLCIEGNTRLSIYRDLKKVSEDASNWETIPALVYPETMERKHLDNLRLQAHFVGKKEWKPYAKGKYIMKLLDTDRTMQQIVDVVGGKATEIRKYAKAYEDWHKYYEPIRDAAEADDTEKFSHFIESRKNAIQECLTDSPPLNLTMSDFAKWVKSGKLLSATKDTRDKLADVLRHDGARDIFLTRGKTIRDAVKKLPIDGTSGLLEDALIDNVCNRLIDLLNEIIDTEDGIKSLSSNNHRTTLNTLLMTSNKILEVLESVQNTKNK